MKKSYNALTAEVTLWESKQDQIETDARGLTSGGPIVESQWVRDFRNLAYRLQSQVEGLRKSTEICNSSQQRLTSAMDRFYSASAEFEDEVKTLKC